MRHATTGRPASWIEGFTRFGYATRGVVFSVIGLLGLRVAVGLGGRAQGTEGALREIGHQPFGQILLGITAIGLASYVLWRFLQAMLNPVKQDGGFVPRIAIAGSGIFYSILALTAAQLAFDVRVGTNIRRDLIDWAFSKPLGGWLVGLVGVVLIAIGLHAIYRGIMTTFMNLYPQGRMNRTKEQVARRIGQVGLTALGLTLCITGGLVIRGAALASLDDNIGIGGALEALGAQPYGPWLLGVTALGFIAYGFHCFALARYRLLIKS